MVTSPMVLVRREPSKGPSWDLSNLLWKPEVLKGLIQELTFEGENGSHTMALPANDANQYEVGATYNLSVCSTVVRKGNP